MKTRLFLQSAILIVLLVQAVVTHAQSDYRPMLVEGRKWYMSAKNESNTRDAFWRTVGEDTIIQGLKCKKIYQTSTNQIKRSPFFCALEEDRKIYNVWEKDGQLIRQIVLDFSLKVGEKSNRDGDEGYTYSCKSIDTIEVKGELYRRFKISVRDGEFVVGVGTELTWVEGIGTGMVRETLNGPSIMNPQERILSCYDGDNCIFDFEDFYESESWNGVSNWKGETTELRYLFNEADKTATVTVGEGYYTGEIEVPGTVEKDGVEYTVTSVGEDAFSHCCNLTALKLPDSVTTIEKNGIAYCSSLQRLILGKNLSLIKENFKRTSRVKELVCFANVPPRFEYEHEPFTDMSAYNITLYVPAESLGDYEVASMWQSVARYGKILPLESSEVRPEADGVALIQSTSKCAGLFDLQGRQLQKKPTKGIYIQNGKKVLGK